MEKMCEKKKSMKPIFVHIFSIFAPELLMKYFYIYDLKTNK